MVIALGVGAAAVIIAAVAGLLLILGQALWRRLLHSVFNRIPLVGGTIAGWVDAVFNSLASGAAHWATDAASALGWPLMAGVNAAGQLFQKVINGVGDAKAAAVDGFHHAMGYAGQIEGYLLTVAANDFGALRSWLAEQGGNLQGQISDLWGRVSAVEGYLLTVVANDFGALQAWLGDAERAARAGEAAAAQAGEAAAANALNSAVSYAGHLLGTLQGDIVNGVQAAESYASSAANAALDQAAAYARDLLNTGLGTLDQAAAAAVAGTWGAVEGTVAPIAGALPGDVAGALGLPGALTGAAPATIAGVLAALVPMVGTIGAEVDRCLTGNCGALNSLGQLFNDMGDLGAVAAIFGLAAAAVADPAGTATAVDDLVSPMVSAVLDVAGPLIGAA